LANVSFIWEGNQSPGNEGVNGTWIALVQDGADWKNTSFDITSVGDGNYTFHFVAVDVVGNEVYLNRTFYVDSKKPKIKTTEPRRGYADGNFEVQFQEENPKKLFLNYGNLITGYRNAELNIQDCNEERNRYTCEINNLYGV